MVNVYTSLDCAYCEALLDWLDSLGVRYQQLPASKLKNLKTTPTTQIGDKFIPGFNRPALKRELKAAGLLGY